MYTAQLDAAAAAKLARATATRQAAAVATAAATAAATATAAAAATVAAKQAADYNKEVDLCNDYKERFLRNLRKSSRSLTAHGSWLRGNDYEACDEEDPRVREFLSDICPVEENINSYKFSQEIVNNAAKKHLVEAALI